MLTGELGEEGLLNEIRHLFADHGDEVIVGIGDDAAVVDARDGRRQALTTDILIEGIHFHSGWQSATELGYKALAVNVSDLAAMGARPKYALVSLGIPPDSEASLALGICRGIRLCADRFSVKVIGGDTAASPVGIVLNIAIVGELEHEPVARSGASAGDRIVVTGLLGEAAAGLRLLRQGSEEGFPGLVRAFRSPEARVEAGIAAGAAGASAMIDISDGIATDLRHICAESGVGARLNLATLPISTELSAASSEHGWEKDELALSGGEDYELLMTFPADKAGTARGEIKSRGRVNATDIGEITDTPGEITVIDRDGGEKPLEIVGYQHFSNDGQD